MNDKEPSYEELKHRLAEAEEKLRRLLADRAEALDTPRSGVDDQPAGWENASRLNQILSAVRNVHKLIISEGNKQQLIDQACLSLVETLDYSKVFIGLFAATTDFRIVQMAVAGFDDDVGVLRAHLEAGVRPHCLERILTEHQVLKKEDNLQLCRSCPLAEQHADDVVMSTTLRHGERLYGVLSISQPKRVALQDKEQELFSELARDLAFALYKIDTIAALKDSERDLNRAQKLTHVGSWKIHLPSRMVSASREARVIYGHGLDDPEKAVTLEEIQTIPLPEYRPLLDTKLRELVHQGSPYNVEFRIKRVADGAIRHIHSVAEYDAAENVVLGTIQDITERKKIEERIAWEHQRLRFILEGSRLATWEWDIRSNETFFDPTWAGLLGYTPEELAPHTYHTWRDLVHPDDLPLAEGLLVRCINGDRPDYQCEYRMKHKKGQWVWISDRGRVMTRDEKGLALRMFGTHADITDRKKEEEAIRASERYLSTIIQATADGFWVVDRRGSICDVNEAYCRMSGYSRAELLGLSIGDLDAEETPEETSVRMKRIIASGWELFESIHRRKDGSTWPIEISVTWLDDGDGQFICFGRDLSERKNAEAQLQLQSLVLDQISDCVTVTDLNGIITYVNQAESVISGFSRSELIGASVEKYGENPNKGATQQQIIKKTIEQGSWRGEVVNYAADGREILMDCRTQVVYRDGEPIALCGIATDITEHKKADRLLQESEERFRDVVSSVPGAVYQFVQHADGSYEIPFLSQGAEQLFECSLEKARDSRRLFTEVHPDDQEYFWSAIESSSRLLSQWTCTFRLVFEDGRVKWLRGIAQPKKMVDGGVCWSGMVFDISQLKQAEDELNKQEQLLQRIFEILPIGLWVADKDGTLVRGNPMGVKIWGAEPKVPINEYGIFKAWWLPGREPIAADDWALAKTIRTGATIVDELLEIEAFDGKRKTILNYTAPVLDENGTLAGAIIVNLDISDRKQLEERLQQAEKMESVGRLAGGIAHDFNNMLGVILGYAELALARAGDRDDRITSALRAIVEAAGRSADLTKQLLAFARKQTIAPKIIDLNQKVSNMFAMLRRLIGEDIDFSWQPGENLAPLKIDPTQIDQILANLCVNARDAISGSGKIIIETGNVSIDEAYVQGYDEISPGDYVLLSVSDNGCGMDATTISHLFEPFFTTKGVGQGTGLGLATVYGIVKQNNGHITVYSEPGTGTTIRIYLPQLELSAPTTQERGESSELLKGTETILLVEDESIVMEMTEILLQQMGYTVLCATSPADAVEIANHYDGDIHLLITDVIMPEMNGRELAQTLRSTYPDMKNLFMSGYTANVIAHHGVLDQGVHFLQKPFSMKDLAVKVRSVLEETTV